MRIEDIVQYPLPGSAMPGSPRFVPAGLAYLAGSPQRLWLQPATGGDPRALFDPGALGVDERALSLEEQLRRERLRQRHVGVTSFQVAKGGERMLVPLAGALFVLDSPGSTPRELVTADGPAIEEPRLSPDGRWVGFVRDAEIYVVPASGGDPVQVTTGARGTGRTNGLAEYCAQEEMHRHQGWWWSPDSQWIAFEEADETHIPVYRIVHQGKDAVGDGAQEDHRYPFTGGPNARVRLGVIPRAGGAPVWMDLGGAEYLARVRWSPDGALWVQTQDRAQQTLVLSRLDPRTGRAEPLLVERSATWINLHDALRFTADGFVWASERDGFQHLYLYDRAGKLVRQLTSGAWMVDAVVGLDSRRVWFTGTADGWTERHLYVVDLAGGAPRRITSEPGLHDVVLDVAGNRFADTHSAADRPPRSEIRALDTGAVSACLCDGADDPRITQLRPPELLRLTSRDGAILQAAIFRPEGAGPWPLIVSCYGGPHVQRAQNGWELTTQLRAQYLRSLGFLVAVVDNRGSARRGHAFEAALYRNMGDVEVRDQADAVRELVARGLADPARVGIYGWSYGGYLAAMCLARAPDVFACACAGAPVTHWDGYDTHYTERYMGLPADNPEGYASSSVMAHAADMRGPLLLVHGMLDENVHFRHTARLVNALNRAGRTYRLLMYPDERHLPRHRGDRLSMEAQIGDFFAHALG
jgi:dipeptidyl-peptidase-4